MAFDFPSNPALNEIFTDTPTGKTYVWNGFAWGKNYSEPPAGVAHPPAETIPVEPPIDGADNVNDVLVQFDAEIEALGDGKVNVSGDTMTGHLVLNADPVIPLHAVTKQYVDALSGLPTGGTVGQVLAINPAGVPAWGAAADGGNF